MLSTLSRAALDRLAPSPSWGRRLPTDIDVAALAEGLGVSVDEIADVAVHDVDHGTSLRSQITVTRVDGTTEALFAKNTPVTFGPGVLDALANLCERETKFYRDLAPSIGTAPTAVLSEWNARTGRSTVVMRDLAGSGFEFSPASEPCTVDQAASVMVLLADLHATTGLRAEDPIFDLTGSRARRISTMVGRTLGKPAKSLVDVVPAAVLADSRILRTHARQYADVLAGYPRAFIHNDTHRGNIGFAADSAILIDWQNCGWGPALKDVAYFLSVSLAPEDRRAHEQKLLDTYLDRLGSSGGQPLGRDDAWFAYRVLAVTGYVAAAVTAMFRDRLQAAANAEEGLRRAVAAVEDLDSFAALRQQIDRSV